MKSQFLFLVLAVFFARTVIAQDAAPDILHASMNIAKAENKNIFLKYSASWCGWCKKLDEQMKSDKCKALFESNYVIISFDVLETENNRSLETPGAFDMLKEHKGDRAGLPYWVILDNEGKLLEDSFDSNGENIGCPVNEEEVDTFISILKNTSNMSYDELLKIAVVFRLD